MPSLYLRLALAAAVLLVVAGVAAGLYHRGYAAGEATVRAREQKAVMEALKQADAQKLADEKTAQGTIRDLQNELASARRSAIAPAPVVRLCSRPAGSRPASPPAASTRPAQPGPPATGDLPEVPAGTGTGPDIGAELQRLAFACELVSARDRALLEWARGISATSR